MKLVVGLGNPGREYEGTRHNMGFMAVDAFADMAGVDVDREMFRGVYGIGKNPNFPEPFLLAKPYTLMNLSGEFVRPFMDYFKIPVEDLLVVYDDMALAPGAIRLRPSGSSGSHKGMQSIINHLGTDKIKRIRIGIGEPPHNGADWVLSRPSGEGLDKTNAAIERASKAIRDYLRKDFASVMNVYNQKE